MTKFLNIRPVAGARVLDPDALPVPEELPITGKMVVDTPFWRRRLRANEVELVNEEVTPEVKDKKKGNKNDYQL